MSINKTNQSIIHLIIFKITVFFHKPFFWKIKCFFGAIICKYRGHKFYQYGIYDHYGEISEVAGGCTRCGFDTHGEYLKERDV